MSSIKNSFQPIIGVKDYKAERQQASQIVCFSKVVDEIKDWKTSEKEVTRTVTDLSFKVAQRCKLRMSHRLRLSESLQHLFAITLVKISKCPNKRYWLHL